MIAGRAQNMRNNMRCRRLAVGAGNTDHTHTFAGIIVVKRYHIFNSPVNIGNSNLRNLLRQIEMFCREYGHGALFRGLPRKYGSVYMGTGNADKKIPPFDFPGIGRNTRDFHSVIAFYIVNALNLPAKFPDRFHTTSLLNL